MCPEDVNEERIVITATLCLLIRPTGKACYQLNALSHSAISTKSEAHLLMLMRCFLVIGNEDLSSPTLQSKELLNTFTAIGRSATS